MDTTSDGVRLLGYREVAEVTGFKPVTIRNYLSASRRAVRERGGGRVPADFPEPDRRVWQDYVKANGQRGGGFTPQWREDHILAYLRARGLEPQGAAA